MLLSLGLAKTLGERLSADTGELGTLAGGSSIDPGPKPGMTPKPGKTAEFLLLALSDAESPVMECGLALGPLLRRTATGSPLSRSMSEVLASASSASKLEGSKAPAAVGLMGAPPVKASI